MTLTFLLPLIVWPRSFPATNSLESWLAKDPLGEVATLGVPVIVAALLISGIVVLSFLAFTVFNSNSIRLLRSSISVVTSFVVAMAVLVSIVVSFVVAAPVSIVLSFVVNSVVVSMAAPPVSIVVSFVFVLAVFALLV